MIRIAICDDSSTQTRIVEKLLEKYQAERPGMLVQSHIFYSPDVLLENVSSGAIFDLLLLDILMPGLNGIELAREIRKHMDGTAIIFMTISSDHALDAYGVFAVQYILKPVTENKLFPVLDAVMPMLKQDKERYFFLSAPESDYKIPFSSIVYVELNNRRLCVYLDNGSTLCGKYLRAPFTEAITPLLEDSRFINPHKSFVLNIEKSAGLRKDSFIMNNNAIVPVSRHKFAKVRKLYMSFTKGTDIK